MYLGDAAPFFTPNVTAALYGDYAINPIAPAGTPGGVGYGVLKETRTQRLKRVKAEKAATKAGTVATKSNTEKTDPVIQPLSLTPAPAPGIRGWMNEEVVIAGKPVKRKVLVGVLGASTVLILLLGTGKKTVMLASGG